MSHFIHVSSWNKMIQQAYSTNFYEEAHLQKKKIHQLKVILIFLEQDEGHLFHETWLE